MNQTIRTYRDLKEALDKLETVDVPIDSLEVVIEGDDFRNVLRVLKVQLVDNWREYPSEDYARRVVRLVVK